MILFPNRLNILRYWGLAQQRIFCEEWGAHNSTHNKREKNIQSLWQRKFYVFTNSVSYSSFVGTIQFVFSSPLVVTQEHMINFGQWNLWMRDMCDSWAEAWRTVWFTVRGSPSGKRAWEQCVGIRTLGSVSHHTVGKHSPWWRVVPLTTIFMSVRNKCVCIKPLRFCSHLS